MLKIIDEILLNNDEIDFLEACMLDFVPDQTYNLEKKNYYTRKYVDYKNHLLNFQKKVLDLIQFNFDSSAKVIGIWINEISNETNINPAFHHDESDFTLITYINENFEGGEFEYQEDNKNKKITPKKYTSLLQNNRLIHRVTPVSNGVRYSLICFLEYVNKQDKTLI